MARGSGAARPLLIYTFGRLALFGVCALVFYLCGMGLLLALLVAALVSSIAAYFLLTKQRDELGLAVEHRVGAARARAAERVAREDAIADEMIAEQERAQHQD
ncbi:hypothetical protein acdb102_08940 [Acidothermaceae bacterium B102]|nr:hypothetical protein acdb102_08940 [Acidothermaceae bacterium B102]